MEATGGLRERKRERTRRTLQKTATRLFLDRGFDAVTVAEIADEADVALTTLFTYYPGGKVALVFDRDEDRPAELARAIDERNDEADVLDAVEAFMVSRLPFTTDGGTRDEILDLILSTPQLRAYARQKWTDCEDVLTAALAREQTATAGTVRALARFILESPDIAAQDPAPSAALRAIFVNLRRGWGL